MVNYEMSGLQTKVVFVPSHRDIMHFETYPMSPYTPRYFSSMFG